MTDKESKYDPQGTEPQEQQVQPQEQSQGRRSALPIATAILIGFILIALALAWGLSQMGRAPAAANDEKEEITINIIMPENEVASNSAAEEVGNTTQTADKPGYGYRENKDGEKYTSKGIWYPPETILEGPAIYKPDSWSAIQCRDGEGIFLQTGESVKISEGAISWGFWGSNDSLIYDSESNYWTKLFRIDELQKLE